jgi:hypothetical protein
MLKRNKGKESAREFKARSKGGTLNYKTGEITVPRRVKVAKKAAPVEVKGTPAAEDNSGTFAYKPGVSMLGADGKPVNNNDKKSISDAVGKAKEFVGKTDSPTEAKDSTSSFLDKNKDGLVMGSGKIGVEVGKSDSGTSDKEITRYESPYDKGSSYAKSFKAAVKGTASEANKSLQNRANQIGSYGVKNANANYNARKNAKESSWGFVREMTNLK